MSPQAGLALGNSQMRFRKQEAYVVLFSSRLSYAERYLAVNTVPIQKVSKSSRLKKKVSKNISNKVNSAKDTMNKFSEGIEDMLNNIQKPSDSPILGSSEADKYAPKNASPFAAFIKNLYGTFVTYGSKGYAAVAKKTKKVAGFVKYSMEKYIKVFQFILAMAMPQWNMPWGSKNDYDTLAHTVTQNSSVGEENLKYNIAYSSLKFRLD